MKYNHLNLVRSQIRGSEKAKGGSWCSALTMIDNEAISLESSKENIKGIF
jgi:hypothetical protein